MNNYLILTIDTSVRQFTTQQGCWQSALSRFYNYMGGGAISIEDFESLIKNKTAKEGVKLFNQLIDIPDGAITFFGRINKPFVSDFVEFD